MSEETAEAEHPLQNTWSVWEHKKSGSGSVTGAHQYGSNMAKLCTFNTVEGFWRFMNHTPPPSDMFTTEQGTRKFGDREIEGISLFKSHIRPEWEDPMNMHGGEFSVRKIMQTTQLDQWWEDILLGTIGETIDPENVITGVRIVDKCSKQRMVYRLEVWFSCNQETDPHMVEAIKERILEALNATIKLDYRPHSNALLHGESGLHGGDHEGGRGHHGRRGN